MPSWHKVSPALHDGTRLLCKHNSAELSLGYKACPRTYSPARGHDGSNTEVLTSAWLASLEDKLPSMNFVMCGPFSWVFLHFISIMCAPLLISPFISPIKLLIKDDVVKTKGIFSKIFFGGHLISFLKPKSGLLLLDTVFKQGCHSPGTLVNFYFKWQDCKEGRFCGCKSYSAL